MYDSLRSAHLERAHRLAPASILYRTERYDFDRALTAGLDVHRVGTAQAVLTLVRSGLSSIEVNEPLMRASVVRTAAFLAVAVGAGRIRRSRPLIVTYAIENRDPFTASRAPTLRARGRAALDRVAVRYVARRVDRIAFGTEAAATLYRRLLGSSLDGAATRVVPALSAPCDCAALPAERTGRVLFLGALHERKGLVRLLEAWPEVLAHRPEARLTVVGTGPLEAMVTDVAATHPSVELITGPPRARIHELLRRSAVLVLLSQPTPTWREQVGLPIIEALSHGCSVVTTTETGLAAWLSAHGHEVLDPSATTSEVAASIAGAVSQQRSPAAVLADLPATDGRLDADTWLFEGTQV